MSSLISKGVFDDIFIFVQCIIALSSYFPKCWVKSGKLFSVTYLFLFKNSVK